MIRYRLSGYPNNELIYKISQHLERGDVGIIPTETVYGLVCLGSNQDGVERIYHMKQRSRNKPFQRLIADLAQLNPLNVPISPLLEQLAKRYWPGPLTIILNDKHGRSCGIRCPKHPFVLALIRSLNQILIATSANHSGTNPAHSFSKCFADLRKDPDFIVFADSKQEEPNIASTIIALKENNSLELCRKGVIAFDDILNATKNPLDPN